MSIMEPAACRPIQEAGKLGPSAAACGEHEPSIMPEPLKPPQEPARKSVLVVIAIVGLLAVGVVLVLKNSGSGGPPVPTEPASPPQNELAVRPAPAAPTLDERTDVPRPTSAPSMAASKPSSARRGPEPSAYTRELVSALTRIDLSKGEITSEQAVAFKQALFSLTQGGAESVPAVREFLEKNIDLDLSAVKGGEQLGVSSLRLALLDALAAIGGPEAIALCAQTLQSTYDPREISQLARSLEAHAPERYRQLAVEAARAALSVAVGGKLEGRDVGPLFNVLTQYGGANAISDLQGANSQWRYYSAIALASLPDSAGVPALIQMADGTGPISGSRSVALQMLAQAAAQSPEARAVLLEQARLDKIPTATWITIGSLLEGHVFQIGSPGLDGNPSHAAQPNMKTYHLQTPKQDFYSVPGPDLPPEQVRQRLEFIDSLLGVNSSPAVVGLLNRAKAGLQPRPQPGQ